MSPSSHTELIQTCHNVRSNFISDGSLFATKAPPCQPRDTQGTTNVAHSLLRTCIAASPILGSIEAGFDLCSGRQWLACSFRQPAIGIYSCREAGAQKIGKLQAQA